MDNDKLSSLSVPELTKLCRELNITKITGKRKQELVDLIKIQEIQNFKIILEFNIFYQEQYREEQKINYQRLIYEIEKKDKNLIEKIEKFLIHNQFLKQKYVINDILSKIQDDELFASHFVISPKKQSFAENLQKKYLESYYDTKLEKSKLRFNERAEFGEFKKNKTTTKTIDFYAPEIQCYFICKYTEEEGGSQNNQENDVISFIMATLKYFENNDNDEYFIFILDGNYYQNKFADLKKLIGNEKRIKITSCQRLSIRILEKAKTIS